MDGYESLWIRVQTHNQSLTVGCTYRPPNSHPDDFCSKLEACLRAINTQDNSILILGDMNGKNNTWLSSDITDRAGDKLSCLFDAYGLHQHVDFPTRITNGLPKSCIDLVVTNYQEHQVQVESAPPLSSSDHLSITGCLGLSTPLPTNHEPTPAWSWSWDNEKVKALQSDLRSTQFLPPQPNSQSCDDLWQHWRDTLLHKAHIYCTTLHNSRKTGSARLQPRLKRPWMNGDVLQAIKKKHKLHRSYLKSRSPEDWTAFKAQRNLTTDAIRKAKSAFVLRDAPDQNSTETNFTHLHSFMKCLKTSPHSTLPDLHHAGRTLSSPLEKATALNEFFITESQKSVGDPEQPMPDINYRHITTTTLKGFHTTPEEVCKLLNDLDHKKSAGDDGIPTKLLKLVSKEISPSLSLIFNISFTRGDQPQCWRDATVSPIHKKGTKTNPSNYRPISLLSVISKVQERIVQRHLYNYVDPHLPTHQSGFRKRDGTELQLARLVSEISESRDNGKSVVACFFDLSKAFDRVWHQGLLAKLTHLGVCEDALAWLSSYLTKRRQRVRVNSSLSPWLRTPAGYLKAQSLALSYFSYTQLTCHQHAPTALQLAANLQMTLH